MPSIVDIIVIGLLFVFFIRGWSRGFLRSILGPVSLAIGTIFAIIYYQETNKLMITLAIGLFGPFAIHIALAFLLKLIRHPFGTDEEISGLSRFLGSIFSFTWSGTLLILSLLLLVLLPKSLPGVKPLQKNILNSTSYTFIHKFVGDKIPTTSLDISDISSIFENPEKLKKVESSEEFQDLMNDKKFSELYNDEALLKDIEEKNYVNLLKNPKMQAIMKDPDLIKKLFAFQKELIDNNLSNSSFIPKN